MPNIGSPTNGRPSPNGSESETSSPNPKKSQRLADTILSAEEAPWLARSFNLENFALSTGVDLPEPSLPLPSWNPGGVGVRLNVGAVLGTKHEDDEGGVPSVPYPRFIVSSPKAPEPPSPSPRILDAIKFASSAQSGSNQKFNGTPPALSLHERAPPSSRAHSPPKSSQHRIKFGSTGSLPEQPYDNHSTAQGGVSRSYSLALATALPRSPPQNSLATSRLLSSARSATSPPPLNTTTSSPSERAASLGWYPSLDSPVHPSRPQTSPRPPPPHLARFP